jgi:anti-sigma B factor antagonist
MIDTNTAAMSGRFDAAQVDTATAFLSKLTESTALDLSGLEYVSSAGLGVFITVHHQLSKKGKKLTLINASNHVRHVIQLSRLHLVLNLE